MGFLYNHILNDLLFFHHKVAPNFHQNDTLKNKFKTPTKIIFLEEKIHNFELKKFEVIKWPQQLQIRYKSKKQVFVGMLLNNHIVDIYMYMLWNSSYI